MSLLLIGYDGSPSSVNAIEVAAQLLPDVQVRVVHLLSPPFASHGIRQRLWPSTHSVDEMIAAVEREGAAEVERLVANGVALARAAGWEQSRLSTGAASTRASCWLASPRSCGQRPWSSAPED